MSDSLSTHTSTVVQLGGSLLILVPFVLVQVRRLSPESSACTWPNLMGSTTLAVDAWHGHQWGFLLLEATWALVSLVSLVTLLRGDRTRAD